LLEVLFVKHPVQHTVPGHDDGNSAVNRLTELRFTKKSYLPQEGNVKPTGWCKVYSMHDITGVTSC